MRDALAADFRQAPGVSEVITLDNAGPEEFAQFQQVLRAADAVLIIAPETSGCLRQRIGAAEGTDRLLLNAGSDAVALCTDKLLLYRHWQESGVATPQTWELTTWPAERLPAVLKPRDGAGSEDMHLIQDRLDAENLRRGGFLPQQHGQAIVQDYRQGLPASIAFLVGPNRAIALPPAWQNLSRDGRFRYEGGSLPIRTDLARRARNLGRKAISCVPGLLGYVGVDLVLGGAADGSEDFAIEINPRLTTSYLGLRALADCNLAEAILNSVRGVPVTPRWKPGRVRFCADGNCRYDPAQNEPVFGTA